MLTDIFGNSIDDLDGITRRRFINIPGALSIYKCPADNYVSAATTGGRH